MIKCGDSIYKEKKKFIQKTQYYLDKKVKYVDKMSFTNFKLYHLDGTIIAKESYVSRFGKCFNLHFVV